MCDVRRDLPAKAGSYTHYPRPVASAFRRKIARMCYLREPGFTTGTSLAQSGHASGL